MVRENKIAKRLELRTQKRLLLIAVTQFGSLQKAVSDLHAMYSRHCGDAIDGVLCDVDFGYSDSCQFEAFEGDILM